MIAQSNRHIATAFCSLTVIPSHLECIVRCRALSYHKRLMHPCDSETGFCDRVWAPVPVELQSSGIPPEIPPDTGTPLGTAPTCSKGKLAKVTRWNFHQNPLRWRKSSGFHWISSGNPKPCYRTELYSASCRLGKLDF